MAVFATDADAERAVRMFNGLALAYCCVWVGVELGIWLHVGIFLAGVWSIVVIVNTELVDTAVVDDDDETNAVSAQSSLLAQSQTYSEAQRQQHSQQEREQMERERDQHHQRDREKIFSPSMLDSITSSWASGRGVSGGNFSPSQSSSGRSTRSASASASNSSSKPPLTKPMAFPMSMLGSASGNTNTSGGGSTSTSAPPPSPPPQSHIGDKDKLVMRVSLCCSIDTSNAHCISKVEGFGTTPFLRHSQSHRQLQI